MLEFLSRFRRPPPEAKASRAGRLIALETSGRASWSQRDFTGFVREGFQKNPVAHRCLRLIAETTASVPWTLAISGQEADDASPLARLLERPSAGVSGRDLMERLYLDLALAGNAYVEAVGDGMRLAELHALRPDRVRPVIGPDGWPEAFTYTAGGREVRLSADGADGGGPVLHLKLHHPLDDHQGLSPVEAAAVALDIHNAAAQWSKAFLDNSARPSGALVYAADGDNLTDEQYERLRNELETQFSGPGNAGRPMLLEGGLDWKPLSLSPRDMDFMALKAGAAREIALAFGVPPLLLGLPGDNTHANYAEANRAFWRQTVAPLASRTAAAFAGFLRQATGEDVSLTPDFDAVDAMNETREPLWRAVAGAAFLTPNEKRRMLGFGPHGDPAADSLPLPPPQPPMPPPEAT
jgi:HK97 family phage portal protein